MRRCLRYFALVQTEGDKDMSISVSLPREKEKIEGLMMGIVLAFAIIAITYIVFG